MSKGGESSRSASAQTPAQWASAQSNTAIAAWREADIVGFSQAQLKALTAAQMSHITVPWAVPAAVWTADTLNAVPLQYWSKFGTRYRVTTNNGVSRITELSQRSGDSASGQCNWFDDLGYSPASGGFAFSAAVIAGINNERIAQIGAGHTLSAPQLTPNADGVISASDFNAALTAATASGESVVTWTISGSETAYMFASGWANMGANFMGALTVSQLGAIAHPETALGAAQFAYLSANQLIALSQMDWSRVSAAQLNATTISAFSGLQTNILRAISETTWGGLDKAHTMALNAADIQLLSASAIANMQYLGYALTANVGAVLTVAQVQSIAANCWAQISDSGFLNALSTAALQAIPVSAFANMADAVLSSLDSTHVAALTANQAANYPLSKLSNASSAFDRDPASLNFADFVASGNVNWRQAPASFIKRLTPEQLHLISPAQFATLSSSALAGLTRSQTQSLTLEQIQSLSASQLSAVTYISRRTDVAQQIFTASVLTQMSLDFWRRVDSDFLNSLSVTAFQAITSGQMTVIAANAFNRLDQAHINALTVTQMLALTAAQVGQVNGAYLTLPFLRGVRLEAFKGLVPEQMRRLHDYLFNTVATNAFSSGNTVELEAAEMEFATLVASIMDGDDGREAWLKQSVDLLIRLQWLDPAAAANLSASDVQNTYATLNWSWMSGHFLNSITTTVFSQLKASNIAQLNVDAVAILNDAHVQVLTATQVVAMSGEQLSAIANLGALQASAVQSLSGEQIAGMTQNWGQINPTFLSHMTARQFMALTPSQFGQLHVAQLAATAIDWRLIAPEQLNALPLTEFSKLCTGDNPAILGTTTGVLLGLGGEQMVILAQAVNHYSKTQVNTVLNLMFGAFSADHTRRMIDLMKNDSAEQVVLQTSLIALLAQIDGSSNGIDAAIQSLVSLRKMQPSWFNVDNLSTVLSVLSQRYTDFTQLYNSGVVPHNLFNYAFNSGMVNRLTRLDTLEATTVNALQVLQGARPLVNRIDFGPLIQRLGASGQLNFATLRQGTQDLLQPLLEALGTLRGRFERIGENISRDIWEYALAALWTADPRGQVLTAAQIAAFANDNVREHLVRNFNVLIEENLPRARLAHDALATQTVLALGGLLVMLGAGIGDFGRAIEAASDRHLSSKERDDLIASASLSALANISLGLQMPLTQVLEKLVRRYTTAGRAGQEPRNLSPTPEPAPHGEVDIDNYEQVMGAVIAERLAIRAAPAPVQLPEVEPVAARPVLLPVPLPEVEPVPPVEAVDHPPVAAPVPEVEPAPPVEVEVEFGEGIRVEPRYKLKGAGEYPAKYEHQDGGEYPVTEVQPNHVLSDARSRFGSFLKLAKQMMVTVDFIGDKKNPASPVLLNVSKQGSAIVIVASEDAPSAVQVVFEQGQLRGSDAQALLVTTESLQALVQKATTTGMEIKTAHIYNMTNELRYRTLWTINRIIKLEGGVIPVRVDDQNFILEHLEDFVWATRENATNDAAKWRKTVLNSLKDILGLDAQLDLETQPGFKDITDKVTQVINEAQISLSTGKVPTKIIDDVVLYAALTTVADHNGVPIPDQSLLTKANKILADQAPLFDGPPPQLNEADVEAATQRLTAKILFNAAKANVLAKVTESTVFDYVPLSYLPEMLHEKLLTRMRQTLGLGPKEAHAIVDSVPSYELKLAVSELTARVTIRRMQQIAQSAEFSMVEKQLRIREVLSKAPNRDGHVATIDVIKATPAMRNYLRSLPDRLTDTHTALAAAAKYSSGTRGNRFLIESLAQTLMAAQLDAIIGLYYESDVTDARFRAITAEQIKALETPLLATLDPEDFNVEGIPTEYAGDIDRYVNEQNKNIELSNNKLEALREDAEQQIRENKREYFDALPEEERLLAKVRYFLSVDSAEGRGIIDSRLTDILVRAINILPANAESAGILEDFQKLGPQSLATTIDLLVTNPAFGASQLEVAGYRKAGGIRSLLTQEAASSVRGKLLRHQFVEIKQALQEAASRRASILGVKVSYRQSTTPLILDQRLYQKLLHHELVSQRTAQSQTQLDAHDSSRGSPTLRATAAITPPPQIGSTDASAEVTLRLAQIIVDKTLTSQPDIDLTSADGRTKLANIARRVVNRLVDGTLEGLPGIYDGIVTWGLALAADGQLNKIVRITVGDLSEAIAFTVATHPMRLTELSHPQQQDLLATVKEHLAGSGAPYAQEIDGIATGLRQIIFRANINQQLTDMYSIRNVLAEIILQRSQSHAMDDLVVATEAVLGALQRGEFSHLPGIYDAIAQAHLGTVVDWQHQLIITAHDLAWYLSLKVVSIDQAELNHALSKIELLQDPLAVAKALKGAVAAVTRTFRADLPRGVKVDTISAPSVDPSSAPSLDPSAAFTHFLASHIVEQLLHRTRDSSGSSGRWQISKLWDIPTLMNVIYEVVSDVDTGTHGLIDREALKSFAIRHQLTAQGTGLNQAITIDADNLSRAIADRLASVIRQNIGRSVSQNPVANARTFKAAASTLSRAMTVRNVLGHGRGDFTSRLRMVLDGGGDGADEVDGSMFGRHGPAARPVEAVVVEAVPQVPAALPADAPPILHEVVVEAAGRDDALGQAREAGIGRGEFQLSRMQIAVSGVVMLSFALFASVVGIAAGIAGLIYAAQSSYLSAQAQALVLAMNGVRVLSSFVMLGASVAQIASNVAKAVQVVADTTRIANAGFLVGNVIGITTNAAQIGIQIKAATDATDDTSRLIAGLSILDATIQLVLNIAGTIALAFGPIGVIVNLVTFIIAALLPSAAAIATAVKYHQSYDDLTSKGLFKEAEVVYMHWQVAALDASPIVNWTSSIYTEEMKKTQERRMDYAWMDKSAQERLLYSLSNNTELKDNFDSLRTQIYAGAAALNQSFVNLGQGLTRAVTLMLSQESLSYFEGDKLATVKQAATFNYLTNTVSRAPKLVSAAVNGQLVTLTFNQNLASRNSQLPNLSAFTVKVDGVATTVSGFALLNNTITLTLATPVKADQVVTFSYSNTKTGNDSHAVQNLLGKNAASITDHAVVNRLDVDHRAPLLVDAVVEDKYVSLLFDEALDSAVGKVPDKTAFTVTIAGNNAAIQSVAVSGQRVLLTLVDKVAVGAVVSFNYTAGEQGLRDATGNKVAALSAQAVDNTSSTATVSASRVGWLQYDNFVASTQGKGSEAASVLNGNDYTVYANEAGAKAGTARLRYLSLSNAVGEFDMYSASRATENSDRIWLDASSAQGLSNFAINTSGMTVWGGQGKNSYSLSRQYANSSYIVAANSWSSDSNVVSLSGGSDDSNHVVNLDYLLTADNISGGLAVTQTPFKVLGSADGLDEVIGSADNQTYYATSNVANVRLTGANANVFVGESAKVNVGWNGRVLVDMDMWRGLNLSQPTTTGVIKGSYGKYSLLNFAPTDTVNDSFIGKLDLRYQIGHLPTLGAFTVNAGGADVAVTQMKISGSKVTLSLASAVQQNQAVRVSYQDVSASNDADTLQDLAGNDVGNFSAQVVSNVTADTTAPTLKVATVQGSSLIVRFSEALLQAVKPLASDFTVKVAGTAVAVSKVAFNDSSSLLLTLASAVSAGQTVSMGYSVASDTTVAVQDLAGNASSGFTNASVVNLASVTVAPGLRSVTANGNVLTLKFDGTLRYTLSDASAFLVTADNTPMTISSVSVVGTSVLLYLASAVTSEQLVEVSYTAPQQASDTTTLRDWLGNGVGNLSAQVATNITSQDLTAPTLQYAIVNGNSLVLTFSEALNGQAEFTPLPSAFAVHVAGSTVSVTQAVVSGATVTLSLATAVDYAAAVSLSYTDLSASNDVAVVQDLAGNDAASFSNINVVNNTPNTTAPSLLSATVTENQLVLLFDNPLNNNAGYLPPLTSMSVNAAGVAVGIVSGSLNGDTATLTLSRAVNPDDYVTFNYSASGSSSSTQAFQDWSGNPLLSIANFSVKNLTGLDLTPPSVVSAAVNGNTLSLTFSEALASTASFTPGLNAFSVYVDGSLNTVSAVTLNGTQAVLSLNRAVSKEQVVTVSYSQPANRPIQDGAGNFAASFNGKAVSNVTVDTSAPTLSSASVAGALLTLTFNENLATDSSLIPSAKQFTVNVDGAVVDVLSAVVAGKVVSVTLNKAVTATQVVSVDYTPATTGTNQLQDASGNATVHFSKTVSNWSGLASIQNATVNGTQLTLTFNQELDAISGHLPPVSAFAVQVAGVNSTVSQLVANGYTLTLTLDTAVNYGQEVTVNYTDPSTANDVAALQNLTGMDVQTFTEAYAVHNLTPPVADVLAPSLNSAVANGNTVTLTFSEALDAGVGEWLVNYLPDGQYDAQGNPVVTSRLQASGFVNVLGSNSNDSFIIGDQSGLAASRQLNYIQLGNGQGVKVSHHDTSGNLLLAMGSTGQADVVLESGSSLQKLLTTKLVQSDADIVKYKAHRDTVTLKTLSSLTAFLAGYEVIDATEASSSLTAQIGGGDHQIKLGGQTVNLQFDKVVSNTSIITKLIPNSWLDYQYFNFNGINADGLWVGRESDGTVLFQAQWAGSDSATTEHLSVNYDGTLSNVVMGVGHVLATAASSQLRLDKLIEVMSSSAFSTDPTAASKAIAVTDTSNDGAQTKLYRVSDIVAYSAQPQSAVTGGV